MRIVEEKVISTGAGRFRSGTEASSAQEYFDRVAKYVPSEVVAAYIAANGVAAAGKRPSALFIAIFVACLVATPLYITRFARTPKEVWTNGAMATAAFIIWAYATGGGLFQNLGWYDAPTGSVILILFTLASGLI